MIFMIKGSETCAPPDNLYLCQMLIQISDSVFAAVKTVSSA